MKAILLTEKEMVFLVLLYIHVLINYRLYIHVSIPYFQINFGRVIYKTFVGVSNGPENHYYLIFQVIYRKHPHLYLACSRLLQLTLTRYNLLFEHRNCVFDGFKYLLIQSETVFNILYLYGKIFSFQHHLGQGLVPQQLLF